jgi:hypothetical protein
MERDLYRVRQSGHGRAAPQDKRSSTRQAERAAILREAGHDPVFLGFLYGWAPDSIRKLRRQRGLDPETGERTPRALTAPASLQLRDHDDRGADS